MELCFLSIFKIIPVSLQQRIDFRLSPSTLNSEAVASHGLHAKRVVSSVIKSKRGNTKPQS